MPLAPLAVLLLFLYSTNGSIIQSNKITLGSVILQTASPTPSLLSLTGNMAISGTLTVAGQAVTGGAAGGSKWKLYAAAGSVIQGNPENVALTTTFTASAGKVYSITYHAMYVTNTGTVSAFDTAIIASIYLDNVSLFGSTNACPINSWYCDVFRYHLGTFTPGLHTIQARHRYFPYPTANEWKTHATVFPQFFIEEKTDAGSL